MKFYLKQLACFITVLVLSGSSLAYSQWIKKGNTLGLARGESVVADNIGNVYSTGIFICNLVFDGDTLFNPTCTDLTGIPRFDGFVVKYNSNGILQWAKQITGEKTKTLSIAGITVDNAGNSYITGYYTGSLDFSGTVITNTTALKDMFIARYQSNGTLDWVRSNFARRANSFIQSTTIAADATGNSFVAGIHKDTVIFEGDTLFPSLTQEFFITKYNAAGVYQWVISSRGDSTGAEASINAITLDISNGIYVTGTFKDTVRIFPGDTLKSIPTESGIFLARYSDPPGLSWKIQENVNGATAQAIALDKTYTNVVIAGQYKGVATIGTDIMSPSGTDLAAFAAKYNTTGAFAWARSSLVNAGDSVATGRGIGVDEFGGVFLAGSFGKKNSTSSITTSTTTKTGFTGYDGFVTKFSATGALKWIQPLGGNLNDEVRGIYVQDSSNVCIAGYFSERMRVDSNVVINSNSGGFNSFVAKMDICPFYSADIVAGGPTTFCREDSVLLTATAGAGYTYQWQKNGLDIVGGTAVTYYALDSASYRVAITHPTYPCVKYSLPLFIKVNPLPNVTITVSGPTSFCTGSNVRLTGPQGNSYKWLNSGAVIPLATTFSYIATTSGNYSQVSQNSYGCIDTSIITIVTVVPYPVPLVSPASKFIVCNGTVHTISANTSTGYTYQWLKNGLVISGEVAATYGATTTGIYKVRISNSLGCAATSITSDTLTIISKPPATLTLSGSTTLCSYETTTLLANTGVGLIYNWERNGIAVGTGLSSYVPIVSGDYLVKVSNATGCKDSSAPVSITINPQPITSLSAGGPISFCTGDAVLLSASTGVGYTYIWQRNSAVLSGEVTANYSALATGNYKVLITDPSTSCSDTSNSIAVITNPLPIATLTALGSTSFCIGDSVELKASSGTGFSYVWKRDGVVLVGVSTVNYFAKSAGLYTVDITNSATCTTVAVGVTVNVFTVPPASITSAGPTTFCAPGSVTLNATTGGTYSYIWRKDGFVLSSETTAVLVASSSGSYSVQVTITGSCTNTSSATVVVVKSNVKPEITTNGTDISTAQYLSYEWRLNGTPISGAANQIYNAITSGFYTVRVENGLNCISISDPVSVCVPAPFITTAGALLKGSTGMNWQWYLEDILINGAVAQNYFAQASGDYKVKVKDASGCESFSIAKLVCVPAPTITLGSNNLMTASVGQTYQWYLDEVEIIGATTQQYIAIVSGNYTVKVEDNNACEAVSMPLELFVTSNIKAVSGIELFCYPNPVSSILALELKNKTSGSLRVEILDLLGNLIQSTEYSSVEKEFRIMLDVLELPAGSYFLRVTDADNNQTITKINKIHN